MPNRPPCTPAQSPDYQFAFQAGRKRATTWFAQCRHSLADYRDIRRAEYARSLGHSQIREAVAAGFDAGFAAGVAYSIAGAHHA